MAMGWASTIATGNTTIKATSGSISGSTILTVTSSFTVTGSMSVPRSHHTSTVLTNGKVLITGGYSSSSYLASAELYDPAAGPFSLTGSMNVARSDHQATLLNNGKVLITGGITAVR